MASQSRFTSTTPLHWAPSSGPNDGATDAHGNPQTPGGSVNGGQDTMQIDPSLLAVPPAFGAPAEANGQSATGPGVAVGQKRVRQNDYAQWARNQAGNNRLSRDAADDVVRFTGLDDDQREITSYIKLTQIEQKLEELAKGPKTSSEAVLWAISTTLSGFIYEEAYETILNPTLANYVNAPKKITCDRLRQESQYNLHLIHMDDMKAGMVKLRAEKKLTDARGKVKDVIEESISTEEGKRIDIFAMCLEINALSNRRKRTLQSPTVAMLGRFAFIRYCYVEAVKLGKEGYDFWPYVDYSLKQLREGNNDDAVKISQVLHSMLLDDQTLYGVIDTEKVHVDTTTVLA